MSATIADGMRDWSLAWMWGVILALVLVLAFGVTPWDAIAHVLVSGGVDDEGAELLAFVAGYTLPLTIGVGIVALLLISGPADQLSGPGALLAAGAILIASAAISNEVGLSQLTIGQPSQTVSGPWYALPLIWILSVYTDNYGWPLALSATAIAIGGAIHLERLFNTPPDALPR